MGASPSALLLDRKFEYLLNRMEAAAAKPCPADHGYAAHRRALFAYVADLQRRAAYPTPPEPFALAARAAGATGEE